MRPLQNPFYNRHVPTHSIRETLRGMDKLRWQSTMCFFEQFDIYTFMNPCFSKMIASIAVLNMKDHGSNYHNTKHVAVLFDVTMFCCFDRRTTCRWTPARNREKSNTKTVLATNLFWQIIRFTANLWPFCFFCDPFHPFIVTKPGKT